MTKSKHSAAWLETKAKRKVVARLLSELLLTPGEELERFRRLRLSKTKLELDSLRQVQDILDGLGRILQTGDEEQWHRVQKAWELLVDELDGGRFEPFPDLTDHEPVVLAPAQDVPEDEVPEEEQDAPPDEPKSPQLRKPSLADPPPRSGGDAKAVAEAALKAPQRAEAETAAQQAAAAVPAPPRPALADPAPPRPPMSTPGRALPSLGSSREPLPESLATVGEQSPDDATLASNGAPSGPALPFAEASASSPGPQAQATSATTEEDANETTGVTAVTGVLVTDERKLAQQPALPFDKPLVPRPRSQVPTISPMDTFAPRSHLPTDDEEQDQITGVLGGRDDNPLADEPTLASSDERGHEIDRPAPPSEPTAALADFEAQIAASSDQGAPGPVGHNPAMDPGRTLPLSSVSPVKLLEAQGIVARTPSSLPERLQAITVEQFASMRAECDVFPERRAEVERTFDIHDQAESTALDQLWRQRFQQSPTVRSTYEQLVARYRVWLKQGGD